MSGTLQDSIKKYGHKKLMKLLDADLERDAKKLKEAQDKYKSMKSSDVGEKTIERQNAKIQGIKESIDYSKHAKIAVENDRKEGRFKKFKLRQLSDRGRAGGGGMMTPDDVVRRGRRSLFKKE